jgi:hypothetical protein
MFDSCKNFKGKGLENWNLKDNVKTERMFYDCNYLIKRHIPSWLTTYMI